MNQHRFPGLQSIRDIVRKRPEGIPVIGRAAFTNFKRQDRTGNGPGFQGVCVFRGFLADFIFFVETYDRADRIAPQLMPNPSQLLQSGPACCAAAAAPELVREDRHDETS